MSQSEHNSGFKHGFIPEHLSRPTPRQNAELPFVNSGSEQLHEPATDIRQLGKVTLIGSGIIVAGSAVVEALTAVDALNTGAAFGIGGSILGIAIAAMD